MSATQRHILHLDMDAFYAAVEQRDNPELRGKPVLVGGSPEGRGVVSTASYEARPFGCHSAMPMAQALRLCPHAIVVSGHMSRYVEVSRQVFAVLEQFTPLIEPLSIDEAFIDVTGSTRLFGTPVEIAAEIKRRVRDETHLTASVGVAPNKFLAKIASDLEKPDGLVVVPPDAVAAFLAPLPIAKLWGAGAVTQQHFERLGVRTFGDARGLSEETLAREFGEQGEHFYRLVRGIDDRRVEPDCEAKSISHEVTFARDIADLDYVRTVLLELLEQVAGRLRKHDRLAQTVTLKVRSPDFVTLTRRKTLPAMTDSTDELWQAVAELYETWRRQRPTPVRLIGVGVSGFAEEQGRQLPLFGREEDARRKRLDRTMDEIQDRFGKGAIKRGGGTRDERL